ncbi:helix-turn-helix domain-containing protein [Streptomyces roseus]|uniref:helix-turn-helix domain-containing protein n=1 Tax=Streptomyces roseus TaxID=66430 RepID=UPI003818C5CD
MVGNHLLQHRGLSATAIGVAGYIQSLPEGAPIGIRALVARFPEGEMRISAALRELERHGYLERRRERLDTGRVVTRTYSYNQPNHPTPGAPPPPAREPDPEPGPAAPRGPAAGADPGPAPVPAAEPAPVPAGEPAPVPAREPAPPPQAPVSEAVPRPLHPGAVGLLAGLRLHDPRLLLSERDVQRLAPDVSAWLDRGADPAAVGLTLSANLPERMRSPASVLAYRLKALLPPRLPAPPAPTPVSRPDPFQTCDGCDRAFRAPHPGRCRDCPPPASRAAA